MMNMEKLSIMMQTGRLQADSSKHAAEIQQKYVEAALAPDQFETINNNSIEKAFNRNKTKSTSTSSQSGTKRRITPQRIQPLQLISKQTRVEGLWEQTQTHFTHNFFSENVRDVLVSIQF